MTRIALQLRNFALAALIGCAAAPAAAQQLVATVNDSPVTDYDLDQRLKMNRVLKLPTSRGALFESIVADRLRLAATKKLGFSPGDQDALGMIGRAARKQKVDPQALYVTLQKAGVSQETIREHFGAAYAWLAYARTLNKSVDVSQTQIRAELARRGQTGTVDYTIRQIIFIVPASDGQAGLEKRTREAEGLRRRFADCASGVQLARSLHDVAVKDPVVRSAPSFPEAFLDVIRNTPLGHLTPPTPTTGGIEVVAICDRKEVRDSEAGADAVRQELLDVRYEQEAQRLYRDLRRRAVIEFK